jgi:hypothetical protein
MWFLVGKWEESEKVGDIGAYDIGPQLYIHLSKQLRRHVHMMRHGTVSDTGLDVMFQPRTSCVFGELLFFMTALPFRITVRL